MIEPALKYLYLFHPVSEKKRQKRCAMCTNEHKNCLKLIKVRFLNYTTVTQSKRTPICSLQPTVFSFKPSSKDYTGIIASKVAILRARAEQNNVMTVTLERMERLLLGRKTWFDTT